MKIKCVLAMFILLIFLVTCKSPSSEEVVRVVPIKVSGVITDANSGAPIGGVRVRLEEWILQNDLSYKVEVLVEVGTDSQGRYYLGFSAALVGETCKMPGNNFRADKAGYRTFSTFWYAPGWKDLDCTEDLQIRDIQLEPLS